MKRLLAALTATFAVVAATGVYQAYQYRPGESQWLSDVHRWASFAFLAVLLAVAVAGAGARVRRTSAGWGANVGLGAAGAAAAACVVTGPDLRWNQLALWAVTVGSDIRGVVSLDTVKYVLVDGREVAFSTFNRTVWIHTTILPVVIAVAIAVVWFAATREGRRAQEAATRTATEEVPA